MVFNLIRVSVKRGVGVRVSFLDIFYVFFLTQIPISRNLYRYNILRYKETKKKMWWSSFFRIIPLETLALQCTFQSRQSNTEAPNFFSSSTPISAIEGHKQVESVKN